MRLQRSLGLAAMLIIISCICAFHTTGAMDIPLEGEFLSYIKTEFIDDSVPGEVTKAAHALPLRNEKVKLARE